MADTGFIRPEVARHLTRWREALLGGAAALLGVWWVATGTGVLALTGAALFGGGLLLCLAGVQLARFRQDGAGPGIVQVVEGQLSYMGPRTGGVIAVRDIARIELEAGRHDAVWILGHSGDADGPGTLRVPVNARGADQLFDVFAALPGIETEAMLTELRRRPDAPVLIWERPTRRLSLVPQGREQPAPGATPGAQRLH